MPSTPEFARLTSHFGKPEWQLLGLLASERALPLSVLEKRTEHELHAPQSRRISGFIEEAIARGLVVDASRACLPVFGLGLQQERAVAVQPHFRSLILRGLAAQGELLELSKNTQRLCFPHSIGYFVTALFSGSMPLLQQATKQLSWQLHDDPQAQLAKSLLRDSLCTPFDADWLQRTWREHAP